MLERKNVFIFRLFHEQCGVNDENKIDTQIVEIYPIIFHIFYELGKLIKNLSKFKFRLLLRSKAHEKFSESKRIINLNYKRAV
jgi:hypothetical protein